MVIAVDFDHTLVDYDKALPGAKEAINTLREQGHKIIIWSCNNKSWIERVLRNNDIRYDWIAESDGGKIIADVYIDDRAIRFNGNWDDTLKEVSALPRATGNWTVLGKIPEGEDE